MRAQDACRSSASDLLTLTGVRTTAFGNAREAAEWLKVGPSLPLASGGDRPLSGVQKYVFFDQNSVASGQSAFGVVTGQFSLLGE